MIIGALDKNIAKRVINKMIGAKAVSIILIYLISIEIIHIINIKKVHKRNVLMSIEVIIFYL